MRVANWLSRRIKPMLTTKILIALLVFLGIVGIGLMLKRILPAGTSIPLSKKYKVIGLIIGGVMLIALIASIIVFLVTSQ
jgi:hypothetical protein